MPVPTPAFANPVIDVDHQATTPLARLVRAYDRAILACEAFEHTASREAIAVLRGALDLESSASRSFDALYRWCEDAVDGHDFVGAAQCLRTLRNAWRDASAPTPRRIIPRRDIPVS